MRTRLKVCCIQTPEEAQLAVELGADAIGLVSTMPSGPGPIPLALMEEIALCVPPGVSVVLLTTTTDPGWLTAQIEIAHAGVVQLVEDRLKPQDLETLRKNLPGIKVMQVLHVEGASALDDVRAHSEAADALLLDSGSPTAPTPTLGGTGRTHDWSISSEIVRRSDKPVWLAGGLTPDNVTRAIAQVRPFGVDICSGIRVDGALNRALLQRLVDAIRIADETVGTS